MYSNKRYFERVDSTVEGRRYYLRHALLLRVTEAIARAFVDSGINQAEVARRLGRTTGPVSRAMSGQRNLTLYSIADLLGTVDRELVVNTIQRIDSISSTTFEYISGETEEFASGQFDEFPHIAGTPDLLPAMAG